MQIRLLLQPGTGRQQLVLSGKAMPPGKHACSVQARLGAGCVLDNSQLHSCASLASHAVTALLAPQAVAGFRVWGAPMVRTASRPAAPLSFRKNCGAVGRWMPAVATAWLKNACTLTSARTRLVRFQWLGSKGAGGSH